MVTVNNLERFVSLEKGKYKQDGRSFCVCVYVRVTWIIEIHASDPIRMAAPHPNNLLIQTMSMLTLGTVQAHHTTSSVVAFRIVISFACPQQKMCLSEN